MSAALMSAWGQARADDGIEFFEKKIRPLLANNCYNCHSADTNSKGGLRVDDRNGLIQGGGRGPAIVPGDPEKSLLLRAVRQTDDKLKMPPEKHLTDSQIADLAQWIKDGAAWTRVELPSALGQPNPRYDKLRKEHWAWQPLLDSTAPAVADTAWPRSDIDRFILARLEAKKLKPDVDADRGTLIRRLNFDLTGLPPTPDQVDAFINDQSAEACERLVDRLLASPAFGERWGRHWLDVARYAESTGPSRNIPYPHAWRYRDYVIAAFNKDIPYDQFLREQIAGDLLPAKSQDTRDEYTIATGFLAVGAKDVNQRFKVRFTMDNVDEQIDTVCKSVLALSAGCARCHDHKFDPIPTTDYYALAGIFQSSEPCAGVRNKMGGGGLDYYDTAMLIRLGDNTPDPALTERIEQLKKELAEARNELDAIRDKPEGKASGSDGKPRQQVLQQKVNELRDKLSTLTDPASSGPIALGMRDAATVADAAIRIRGEAEKLGPVVPRGFLSVIDVPEAPKIGTGQSGRLELATWLTSPRNPLTQRVIVNRIWRHLFGQGLVTTVDNFGVTGDHPSHPELLDYLVARFVREGWSIKHMIRTIVLSRAYQLSSAANEAAGAVDPANRLIWRHSPRRLEAEEIRDTMLFAAGRLDLSRVVGSPAKDLKVIELTDNGPEAKRLVEAASSSVHRSVYLPLLRGLVPHCLEVFDFAEQGMVTGSRDTTTVPTQALYLLNDPFVRRQSQALAARLLEQTDLDDSARVNQAYRLALSRCATEREIDRAVAFLAEYEAAVKETDKPGALPPRMAAWHSFCQALLASAEFRFVR